MFEQELKLTAPDEETLRAVLSSSVVSDACIDASNSGWPLEPQQFLARYYDTQDLELARNMISLRARREGSQFRAALKMKGVMLDGLSQRQEFECDITDWLSCAADLPECTLKSKALKCIAPDRPLIQRVGVDMQRTIRWLEFQGAKIELVTDHALISGKNGQATLYEVELELKQGEVDAIVNLGNLLTSQFSLTPSTQTKYGIGLSLS